MFRFPFPSSCFRVLCRTAGLWAAGAGLLQAQTIPDRIQVLPDAFSTGATSVTVPGQGPCGYVVWQVSQPGAPGSRPPLEVWVKSGDAEAAGTYTLQATVRPAADAATVKVLLARAQSLLPDDYPNQNKASNEARELEEITEALYIKSRAASQTLQRVPELALRLAALVQRSFTDSDLANTLRRAGLVHPAIRLALGEAWAGPLPVANGALASIELRETSSNAQSTVLGRVTLSAGQPTTLVSPGQPVVLQNTLPDSDLTVKLRWAVPDALRRQILLTQGFRLYRTAVNAVPAAPTLSQLRTTGTRLPRRACALNPVPDPPALPWLWAAASPVPARKLFDATTVADLNADSTTFFYADDNNRRDFILTGPGAGTPLTVSTPFAELQRWWYFVVTVDLLGRESSPSPMVEAKVYRTIPPEVPAEVKVDNISGAGQSPRLRLTWRVNGTDGSPVNTQRYEIIRGRLPDGTPANLGALDDPAQVTALTLPFTLPQPAGPAPVPPNPPAQMLFDDPLIPQAADIGRTFWYAVRALHQADATVPVIRSRPSPPAFAVFRDRVGPPPPTGQLNFSCPRPGVIDYGFQPIPQTGLDGNTLLFRVEAQRTDQDGELAWAQFTVNHFPNSADPATFTGLLNSPQLRFAPGSNSVFYDLALNPGLFAPRTSRLTITCTVGSRSGAVSHPATRVVDFTTDIASPRDRQQYSFFARSAVPSQMSPTSSIFRPFFDNPPPNPDGGTPTPAATLTLPASPWLLLGRTMIRGSVLAAGAGETAYAGRQVLVRRSSDSSFVAAPFVAGRFVYFQDPLWTAASAPLAGTYRVYLIREPAIAPRVCGHQPLAAYNDTPQPVEVVIIPTATSVEWRLLRRVDEGELSLIGQGTGSFPAGAGLAIIESDKAMPPTGGVICYFAQTVDESGNPSALVPIGNCLTVTVPVPTPELETPLAQTSGANRIMHVRWACPRAGVERFVVHTSPSASHVYPSISTASAPLFNLTVPGQTNPAKVTPATSASLAAAAAHDPDTASSSVFSAGFIVEPQKEYAVWVEALGAGQVSGPVSVKQTFTWSTPPGTLPVAWPARPLPPGFDWSASLVPLVISASAVTLPDATRTVDHLDSVQLGVRIGRLPVASASEILINRNYLQSLGRSALVYRPNPGGPQSGRANPNLHLLTQEDDPTAVPPPAALPAVLYRRQTNQQIRTLAGNNVTAPGWQIFNQSDLVQCSPMVSSISWLGSGNQSTITDPHIIPIWTPTTQPGLIGYVDLLLLDTLPATAGATYAYYLARFLPNGEVDRFIYAGSRQLPSDSN